MHGRTHPLPVLLAASLFLYAKHATATTLSQTFVWGINTNLTKVTSNGLAACSSVPIYVGHRSNDTSTGTPPYTMYAFEVGGYPTVQAIGSDPTNLTWVVDHAPGTTLMLSVLDSHNNTGGVDTTFYYVTDGPSTCQPSHLDSSSPSISPNATDQLETCQPWRLTLSGGVEPYTVWLPSLNSDQLTVVNMLKGNNVLIYPNQAVPNSKLMASVYDSTGAWGKSTVAVATTGSNDTTCSGSSIVQISTIQTTGSRPVHSAVGLRIGVIVGVVALVCLLTALGLWYWRRRRTRSKGVWDKQDILGNAWESPSTSAAERHPMYQTSSMPSSVPLLGEPNFAGTSSDIFSPTISPFVTGMSGSPSSSNPNIPIIVTTSDSSPSRSKMVEAQNEQNMHRHPSSASSSQLPSSSSQIPSESVPPSTPGAYDQPPESDVRPSVIIQHLDGGSGGVQELPPPYMDRSNSDSNPTEDPVREEAPRGKNETRG